MINERNVREFWKNHFFGKHHSEESKKKMSEANKGNKYRLGKKHSEETKRKISEARKRYCASRRNDI